MKFTEVRLVNTPKGEGWELHRAGCADIARTVAKYHADTYEFEADSVDEAAHIIINDECEDLGYTIEEHLRILPCAKAAS